MVEHEKHIRQVLQQLENRLFVKEEKCEFYVQLLSFLGFIVEQGQLQADLAKIKEVVQWPEPQTRTQLPRFMGFANLYRHFI